MGCWFSVGPAMLAGERGRSLVSRMPQHRVLTETDGHFALLDGASAFPLDVSCAVEALGSLWNLTATEVQRMVDENLRDLLKRI